MNSLRVKLIVFTFGLISLTLFIAGLAINLLLANLYGDKAKHDSLHAYNMIYERFNGIENNITKEIRAIAKNPDIIAPTNLVNQYQDIKNYESLVFDQEKKHLANHLLEHLKTFQIAKTAIYDVKGNLIAYAEINDKGKILGITTYVNGEEVYSSKEIKEPVWGSREPPEFIDKKLNTSLTANNFVSHFGNIEYHSGVNNFTLTGIKKIFRKHLDSTEVLIGYVKIIRVFDDFYIKDLEEKTPVSVSILLANNSFINEPENFQITNDLERKSHLFGSKFSSQRQWLNSKIYYTQSFTIPVENGKIYLLLSQSRDELEKALNKSRYLLLFVFLVIAITVIPYGIYWLSKRVSRPLNILTNQLSQTDENHYPDFYVSQSKDEISQLGNGLNSMVEVIKSREDLLKSNQVDLKEAQHLSGIGSWKLNLENNELTWSDEIYNIFEIDKNSVVPSFEVFLDLVFDEDRVIVEAHYENLLKNKKPFDLQFRVRTKSDLVKYINAHSEVCEKTKGSSEFARGTLQDVTKQKQNDELLNRTQKMDALGKLTGGIAHDFNNMLGIIMGYSELLQNSLEGDKHKLKYINHVIDASKRASALTSKLLAFSRKEAATIEDVDINASLLDDRNLLEKTLTSRIELVYDLEEGLWHVLLDKSDLQNAILNMTINAMHAMKNAGRITIKTLNIQLNEADSKLMNLKAGDYVQISITDTGMGMSEEVRNKLFDPFFSTKGDEGTGLGMSQVYGFVQQTGGNIYVYSELGHGTRIVINLPRNEAYDEDKNQDNELDIGHEYGHETILIVDDEIALQKSAAEILQRYHYNVLVASNGAEALKILETENVDLVITDVIMPEMDGYKLSYEIRERYPDMKIQVVSGFSDDETLEIVNKELQQQRLQKPYTFKDLLTRVRSLLDRDSDSINDCKLEVPVLWSDSLVSGIDVLDEDHKTLVDMINRCADDNEQARDNSNTSSILHDLVEYVDYHFKREEMIMDMCGFSDTEKHKKMHNVLNDNVSEYVQQFGNGTLPRDALCKALKKWLVNHIVGHDLPMAQICKDKFSNKDIEQAFKDAGYDL